MRLLRSILAAIILISAYPGQQAAAQPCEVTLQSFYDGMTPYGRWLNDTNYGYVWIPTVEGDFRPYYTNGYWAMTEYGNTWVSGYPWGWAAFHYGRWTYDPFYQWIWVPGFEWGPAWVSWRSGQGYYGWAPLPPGFELGVSTTELFFPDNWWVFIPARHIHNQRFHSHAYSDRKGRNIIRQTTIINNIKPEGSSSALYAAGPTANDIQREAHHDARWYRLAQTRSAGLAILGNDTLQMFCPIVTEDMRAVPSQLLQAPRPVSLPRPIQSRKDQTELFKTYQQHNEAVPNAR